MNINFSNIEGTSEKLLRILRSHKKVPLFTLKALYINHFVNQKIKYLQKMKMISFIKLDIVPAKAVYCGESKQSLKSLSGEHKISVKISDCEKNETVRHCWRTDHNFTWEQKKVSDRESKFITA